MRLNKFLIIFTVLLGVFFCTSLFAQRTTKPEKFNENHSPFGRKKRERSNQKRSLFSGKKLFRKGKSQGNADEFASNSGHSKRGLFSRIFRRGSSNGGERNASLRKTKPGATQNHEQRGLFRRHRTSNKNDHQRIQSHQGKERKKKRIRGNEAFKKKKR